jgi:predicted aconitase
MALYAIWNSFGGVHIREARSPRHAVNLEVRELVDAMGFTVEKITEDEARQLEVDRDRDRSA